MAITFANHVFRTASRNLATVLKNLALAYAQLVKSNQNSFAPTDPFMNVILGAGVNDNTRSDGNESTVVFEP
ncbi:hypothetical protein PsorP6_002872 [Peronosclerospora sorghi]|uniref:Uncharacterized protein n=1 Tax=Peronosclerospora sorghi TaxID=230839 RepID=A0ACC0VMG3_9STRA|nr:hypothetical protein PsorP6_002872 [Peronosclerospora sorghi]